MRSNLRGLEISEAAASPYFFALVPALLAALTAPSAVNAAPCDLDRARYSNKTGDYVLTFPPRTGGITTYPAHLWSKSARLELSGDVVWTNGVSRPYLTFYKVAEEELYTNEAYGLRTDKKGRIVNAGFPIPNDPAPPAILLPNLSATTRYPRTYSI